MPGERSAPLRAHDPRRLGTYELVGRLGEGGMGTVFLARTPAGVLVAVKVVRADLAPDDEFRRRFRSEVDRVRQVPPFCTAEVLDADPDHEHPYLVVEYVDGPTLAEVVEQRGPLTAANLHGVAIGVATALTAIHGAGVIHRDLKPRNVLLAPGSPKVIDFGIARATEATGGVTQAGQMVGTVAYMAPERFGEADVPISPAADVFAWGGVVAYAGTGRTPFGGDSAPATAGRILTQEPDLTGLTGSLRDLVAAALQKDPADRPSARELLELLVAGPSASAAALAGQPGLRDAARQAQSVTGLMPAPASRVGYEEDSIITVPVSGIPMPEIVVEPPARRRRWFLPFAVTLLLVATLAGAGMVWFAGTKPQTNPASSAPGPIRITDDLATSRLWLAKTEPDGRSSCSFDRGLVVRIEAKGLYKCRGPQDDLPSDLNVAVGVRLLTENACASIWFRYANPRGYQVRICEDAVYVGTHKEAATRITRTLPLDDPIKVGDPVTRIGLKLSGENVTVLRDGVPMGTVGLADAEITGSRVLLGVFTDRDAPKTGPFAVAFDHIDING
jgi:predicted Ser/Thr protein kinase